jgi:transcriptional regulator with XRE-family HTH domain
MTGAELRAARINKGLSRRGLAREIQVPEQTLRRLESGQSISPRYAKRVADHFGLAVTDLLPSQLQKRGT